MESWLQKLMDMAFVARDECMMKDVLHELTRELGFDHYAYLKMHPTGSFAYSDYHQDWQTRYFARYYENLDPVVARAKTARRSFTWDNEKERKVGSKEVRKFCDEANDFGVRKGLSIPIWTGFGHMSLMTFSSQKVSYSLDRAVNPVMAANAVALLHARIEQFEVTPSARAEVRLTAKQAVLLRWAAEGKSMRAIATIENMSFHNVIFHLNKARKALNAGTLSQATALATKLGLI